MRVYIAADSHFQYSARELRDALRIHGIECTSRWLDAKLEAFNPVTEDVLNRAAHDNFLDIDRALFLIAFNPEMRQKMGTGGRHVELGYALARGKTCLYVGEKLENVFHRHTNCRWIIHTPVDVQKDAIILAGAIKHLSASYTSTR